MAKLGELKFNFLDGEDIAVLTEDYVYEVGRRKYFVPQGTHWDGASIPSFAWSILKSHPFDHYHRRPSCGHDYDYSGKSGKSRLLADWDYYCSLRAEGTKRTQAIIEFLGVRFFGKSHWSGDKRLAW